MIDPIAFAFVFLVLTIFRPSTDKWDDINSLRLSSVPKVESREKYRHKKSKRLKRPVYVKSF